jgi:hypothetical protein
MKNRNRNKEVCPKHQKQIHEKKKQNVLWKQRNIGNKYDLRKKNAFKYYATREISAYNVGIDDKVNSGLLAVEIGNKVNYPRLKTGGMSREGCEQLVDKEA